MIKFVTHFICTYSTSPTRHFRDFSVLTMRHIQILIFFKALLFIQSAAQVSSLSYQSVIAYHHYNTFDSFWRFYNIFKSCTVHYLGQQVIKLIIWKAISATVFLNQHHPVSFYKQTICLNVSFLKTTNTSESFSLKYFCDIQVHVQLCSPQFPISKQKILTTSYNRLAILILPKII